MSINEIRADAPLPAGERAKVRHRYDRVASVYDLYDSPMDWAGGRKRRHRVISRAQGRTLEVGIGTGRNLAHYPDSAAVTGIDLSGRMLARAVRRIGRSGSDARLLQANVESLPFPDATFDTVTATCVFCSVADPVTGLAEVARVTRPGGRILLLEHVRPRSRVGGWLADRASPLTRRLFGASVNRRTEDNVRAAGLDLSEVRRAGIWREMLATPSAADQDTVGRRPRISHVPKAPGGPNAGSMPSTRRSA